MDSKRRRKQLINMKHRRHLFMSVLTVFIVATSGCYYDNKQNLTGGAGTCDTINTQFSAVINPILIQNCTNCHGGSAPSGGISLEGYTNIKNNHTAILSAVSNGTMPKGSPRLDDCSILKIHTWINRGTQNN